MNYSTKSQQAQVFKRPGLKKLTVEQVEQIDQLLSSLGEYGEIHLIVQRGVLKYVNRLESHQTWKDEEFE